MLDTVIINLPTDKFKIFNLERFSFRPRRQSRRFVKYLPQVFQQNRFGKVLLKIEFSVPKLVFGNNLDELEESDFKIATQKLQRSLQDIGIQVSLEDIANSQIVALHASKNIPLNGGYTASSIIRDLQKIDLTKRLDLQDTKYRNAGEITQLYAKSHAFAIYDKVADILKTNGRSLSGATPKYQELLKQKLKEKPLEVLRLEVRLQSKDKMNQVLAKLGYQENPSFKDIFNKNLCKDIVQDYWKNVTAENMVLFEMPNNPDIILRSILTAYPNIKPQKACSLAFIILYAKDQGMRQLRQILGERITADTWYRVSKEYKEVSKKITKPNPLGYLKIINEELNRFSSYKLDSS